jgi:hypothetical protein
VLEQVRESSPARPFVGATDVVPEVHRDYGRCVVFREGDEQPVIEMEGFYRNSHCRKLPAMQTYWNPL